MLARQQPKIIRDLVALAPAGVQVTVEHVDRPVLDFGTTGPPRWQFSFESDDVRADVRTYQQWFEENGFPAVVGDDGMSLGVCAAYTGLGTGENPDTGRLRILGTVGDDAIDANGNLVALPAGDCS